MVTSAKNYFTKLYGTSKNPTLSKKKTFFLDMVEEKRCCSDHIDDFYPRDEQGYCSRALRFFPANSFVYRMVTSVGMK